MAILDTLLRFSDSQDLSGAGVKLSTTWVDGKAQVSGGPSEDQAIGEHAMKLLFVIETTFTLLTNLTVELLSADDAAMTTNVVVHASRVLVEADGDLVAANAFNIGSAAQIPSGRFWRVRYTHTGTDPGAGVASSYMIRDAQANFAAGENPAVAGP